MRRYAVQLSARVCRGYGRGFVLICQPHVDGGHSGKLRPDCKLEKPLFLRQHLGLRALGIRAVCAKSGSRCRAKSRLYSTLRDSTLAQAQGRPLRVTVKVVGFSFFDRPGSSAVMWSAKPDSSAIATAQAERVLVASKCILRSRLFASRSLLKQLRGVTPFVARQAHPDHPELLLSPRVTSPLVDTSQWEPLLSSEPCWLLIARLTLRRGGRGRR